VWRRAALGAVGWIWLALVGLIGGHGIYTELPPGIPRSAVWMGSLDQTVSHTLWPVAHSGLLAPALVWAVAAALLPWMVRGPTAVRLVLIVVWSAAVASATSTLLRAFHPGTATRPGAVALGAVAGAVLASIPTLLGARASTSASSDAGAGLA
jgi:hypothetical protein